MQISINPPDATAGGNHVLIAVMGPTGSGKTTFVNLASNSNLRVGNDLLSCTTDVQTVTFELDGYIVTLVDTPGFDDTNKTEEEVLSQIAAFMATSYKQGVKLSGILYFHRITDTRFSGLSRKHFKTFWELCGEQNLESVAIITTMWGKVDEEQGSAREQQLATEMKFFKPALQKGAEMKRHSGTAGSAHGIVRSLLKKRPKPFQIQVEMVDQGKPLKDTAAGAEVNRLLKEQEKRHKEEMDAMRRTMEDAMKYKDQEMRAEFEETIKVMKEEIERRKREAKDAETLYRSDQEKMRKCLDEMTERIRKLEEKEKEKDSKNSSWCIVQ